MKTAIAIFVKTPTLSPVKTRLASSIGKDKAQEFYLLALKAVQSVVKATGFSPRWAVAEEQALSHPLWQDFKALWTGEGGLGERQHRIYKALLQDHDRVLLIGADAPQISKTVLEQAVTALNTHDFVIGPARDGGYYLFGGRIPVPAKIWASVPWSADTTRLTLQNLLPSEPARLPLLTDADTQGDLHHVLSEMPESMREEQKRVAAWIERNTYSDSN